MNSADLMVFAAVAEAGSIGRAASALNTVQSNVTGRVIALERSLGVPLFYRGSKGVTLTGAGERLLPYATQVARALKDARQAIGPDGSPLGVLRIGSMETTAAFRLPGLLSTFMLAHPGIDLDLETGPTELLIDRVLDRGIEGAFVSGPVLHADLQVDPVFVEDLVLVGPSTIAALDDLLALLSRQRGAKLLVFRSGCSYRQRLEAFMAGQGLMHLRRMEFGTLDGILGCVAAGLGVTMVPRVAATALHRDRNVSLHALPGETGRAVTYFVRRRDLFETPAFAAFRAAAIGLFGGGMGIAPATRRTPRKARVAVAAP